MEYTITPLTPHTGAEVRGIDLNEGVDTETRAAPGGVTRADKSASRNPRFESTPLQQRVCKLS